MAALRKGSLRDDRRYSRERVWVKPTGTPGVFRLGVAIPAIGGDAQDVYFAEIRGQGAIHARQSFGFLDLDTGRFDLLAPLSGRLVRRNAALTDDPGLIVRRPFDEGWVADIAEVRPADFDRLFSAADLFAFITFEQEARALGLEPILSASQSLESGVPWPVEMRVALGGKGLMRGALVRLGRNESFTPQWSPGDKWRVRCEFLQPSTSMAPPEFDPAPAKKVERVWEYEVEDLAADFDGTPCYAVKVVMASGAPPQRYLRLLIGRDDFALRAIDDISMLDPSLRSRTVNLWGAEGYMNLRDSRELVVDLPLFPLENRDESRVVEVANQPTVKQ